MVLPSNLPPFNHHQEIRQEPLEKLLTDAGKYYHPDFPVLRVIFVEFQILWLSYRIAGTRGKRIFYSYWYE
jgi:hypothetical protein